MVCQKMVTGAIGFKGKLSVSVRATAGAASKDNVDCRGSLRSSAYDTTSGRQLGRREVKLSRS